MANDDAQTDQSPSQRPAANARPSRWRQPTRSRALAVAPRTVEPCALAILASEAAAVLRLKRQLRNDAPDADTDLIAALEAPEDFVRPGEMLESLWDRLKAIESLAPHRRATSLKGALFQLYLAASASQNPGGHLTTKLSRGDEAELERNDRRVIRLHYGAISFLETQVQDGDLAELRQWFFKPLYDVEHACDRAMQNRAALLQDARQQPVTPSETSS